MADQSAWGGEYTCGVRLKTLGPTPPTPLPAGRGEWGPSKPRPFPNREASFSLLPAGRGARGGSLGWEVGSSPNTTAPNAGRRRVSLSVSSAPSTNAAVDIASASAAVGAITLALAVPL